jgi:hypothetical protein
MKVTVERDGVTTEITLGVQILYDALVSSMDFSSGFLDAEEIGAINDLADAAGFQKPCFACAYPSLNYPAAPDCYRSKLAYEGHCRRCEVEYYKGRNQAPFWQQYDISKTPHWPLCPNQEAS